MCTCMCQCGHTGIYSIDRYMKMILCSCDTGWLRVPVLCTYAIINCVVTAVYMSVLEPEHGKGFCLQHKCVSRLGIVVCTIKSAIHSKGPSDLRWFISQTPCVPISRKFDVLFFCCCKLRYFSFQRCQQINAKKRKKDGGMKEETKEQHYI